MSESPADKPELLIVDDSKVIRLAASKMLAAEYTVLVAEDGVIAWEILQHNSNVSVVFTDLSMPNLDGMGLLEKIRGASNDHLADLPVIIMTGAEDTDTVKQAVFDAGGTDFISKPFAPIDLLSRAKSYVRLSRKVVELEKKTGYDKLTGLYNANLLAEQGAKAFSFSSRHQLNISVVYVEIENFGDCFLSHGRNVAQHIILAVGKRLQEVMREEDIAARLDVAKFALILPMTSKKKTQIVIDRIRDSINKLVFVTGEKRIRLGIKIGYSATHLTENVDFNAFLEQADDALRKALSSSTEQVVCFNDNEDVMEPLLDLSEQDVEQAFTHIIDGNFYLIPEQHLNIVNKRLVAFTRYVEDQQITDETETSPEKKLAQ